MATVTIDMNPEEALRTVMQCSDLLGSLHALGEVDGNDRVGTMGLESICMQLDIASAVFSAELFCGAYDFEIRRVNSAAAKR